MASFNPWPFEADSDYEEQVDRRRWIQGGGAAKRSSLPLTSSKRPSLQLSSINERHGSLAIPSNKRGSLAVPNKLGSVVLASGKRASIFQNLAAEGRRDSVYQLFDDPYSGAGPRRLTMFPEYDRKPSLLEPEGITFQELSRQQTYYLRKRLLYKGEYRVLNISVLVILGLVIFGIVFMSAWHTTNGNFWVLYLVLGLICATVALVLTGVRLYFYYQRYRGSGAGRKGQDIGLYFQNQGYLESLENVVEESVEEKRENREEKQVRLGVLKVEWRREEERSRVEREEEGREESEERVSEESGTVVAESSTEDMAAEGGAG